MQVFVLFTGPCPVLDYGPGPGKKFWSRHTVLIVYIDKLILYLCILDGTTKTKKRGPVSCTHLNTKGFLLFSGSNYEFLSTVKWTKYSNLQDNCAMVNSSYDPKMVQFIPQHSLIAQFDPWMMEPAEKMHVIWNFQKPAGIMQHSTKVWNKVLSYFPKHYSTHEITPSIKFIK